MREAILITGTGKSGTTIVSKAFFDAGAPMGDESELSTFAGGGGNIRGVWEHQEAMDLNKAILAQNGIDWYQVPRGPLTIDDELEERIARFVAARPETFCMKDPRFLWTVDVWARHLERVRLVNCFRSPLGFVKSAHRVMPDLFPDTSDPSGQGLTSWVALNRRLIDLSTRFESVFFSFDDPPLDMVAALQNLLWYFGLAFDEQAFERFFEGKERRFSTDDVLVQSRALPPQILAVWDTLQDALFSALLTGREPGPRGVAREVLRIRHKYETCRGLHADRLAAEQQARLCASRATAAGREVGEVTRWDAARRAEGHGTADVVSCPPEERTYDLVVPCYNAPELTRKCVESLLATTDPRHRILLLDDRSPDAEVAPMLQEFARQHAHIEYHLAPDNRGFPATCNWGIRMSDRDVILVNNDAEFAPGWLARMDRCLRSNPRLAAVSPMSNNATIGSVPQLNGKNVLPEGTTLAEMAERVARASNCSYPRVPTVVGFCMLMTREAIDRIGLFDESFGLGYGEEVDWCQRAWVAGFECALCDDAYVYHHGEAGQASAGRVKERQQANEREVARRWPLYHRSVYEACLQDPLRGQRLRLFDRLVHAQDKPRLMQVVHAWESAGGTELHTRDLVRATRDAWNVSVVYPRGTSAFCDVGLAEEEGAVVVWLNNTLVRSRHWYRATTAELRAPHMERLFAETLEALRPDVVHFQHLIHFGSFALPAIARSFGAKVVLTLHDYFLLCPEWNLIGPDKRDCGATDPRRCRKAEACLEEKHSVAEGHEAPPLDEFLRERRGWVEAVLEAAHLVIAPSEFVKAQFERALGGGQVEKVIVIPHGTHPFEQPVEPLVQLENKPRSKKRRKRGAANTNQQGDRVRVAFVGNFDVPKGASVFLRAAELVRSDPVKLEVVGAVGDVGRVPRHVVCRGPYEREELPGLLAGVAAVVVPSIWHETYCYTVDEAFRLGIPVIASRSGAIVERVKEEETGLLFELDDADGLAAAIRRVAREPDLRERLRAGVARASLNDNARSMQVYDALYRRLRPRKPDPSGATRALMDQARAMQQSAGSESPPRGRESTA